MLYDITFEQEDDENDDETWPGNPVRAGGRMVKLFLARPAKGFQTAAVEDFI